ncbi:MAG: DivIVA domain-containing protein [Clostridia bacterium]|nr:DivIVA domain-containing protein [Clostridia bacterium]MBO5786098.1 DivIVA domain-containing protein [Clostridia bacterium]
MAEAVFKKVFKGYDTKQVDDFIVSLSDTYAENEADLATRLHEAETENQRLREEIASLKAEAEEREREHIEELAESKQRTDELCAEIGEKMVVADKRAAEIIRNAEKEANLIITEARRSTENEVKAIRARAEEEAALLVAETKRKCESINAAADEIRARQNEMNKSLIESENRFNSALSKLCDDIGEE